MWGQFIDDAKTIIHDITEETVNEIDEQMEINKKKTEYKEKGVKLQIHQKNAKKEINALHGKLNIKRTKLYSKKDKVNCIPKDEYLEIHKLPFKMTIPAMNTVAFIGQNEISFNAGSEMLKNFLGIETCKNQVRLITEYVGKAVYENDTKRAEEQEKNLVKIDMLKNRTGLILYIMIDGAAINTRIEDVNGFTWRECKSAIAFKNKDLIKRKDGSQIILQKECVSLVGSAEELRKYLLLIAVMKGYGKAEQTVVVSDGATWIRNICKELFPDATQILDLFHLKENIYTYAKSLFSDENEYTKYAKTIINYIEMGEKEKALKKISKDEKKKEDGVVNLKTYIENNYDKIDYPEYWRKGYFVGYGAMESANKVLVQRILKQAGMRWSVEESQHIVSLRAKFESRKWESVESDIIAKVEEDYQTKL